MFFSLNLDDQSDDDSSASVAEPAYSPDKEEGRTQVDVTDHDHLEQRHRKGSEKPWLSPCHNVPKRISSPLKCPDFEDFKDKDETGQKKSKRTSVRKKLAEKHKSVDLLESSCEDRRSDNSKNADKEKRRSQIKSSDPSPQQINKSEKGKRKIKAAKSFTETKTHFSFYPDAVNSSRYRSPPATFGDAAVELSKKTPAPLPKTPKRARTSFSALVQSFTLSSDSKSVASCSTDGGDDVFEDFFSPANRQQKSKRPLLPNLPVKSDIQVPFELDSVPKKRKQRRSESMGSETNSKKKRKGEQSQSGINRNQQSDVSSEPQSHPQQDVEESLPALVAKRRRQSTLPFTNTSTTTSNAVKQRRASTSAQPTLLTEAHTAPELQKNSDVSVLSDTLESE